MKDFRKLSRRRVITGGVLILLGALLGGLLIFQLRGRSPAAELERYDYRDTRRLVALTSRAAGLVGEEGERAFEIFRRNPAQWTVGQNTYLYVYTLAGVNLYHGGYPELAGQDLSGFTDLLGKQTGALIVDQLTHHRKTNPHGWVHYLWVPPGALDGSWKSSCNFAVTLPDGREAFVGSGLDDPLPEREFYRIIVDEAAELLERSGRAALDELLSAEGFFTIHDRGVFVIDQGGVALIDPGLALATQRNLFLYRDLSGRRPMRELAEKLSGEEGGWVIMLNREKGGSKPVKKGIYGRRARMAGQEVIVGAICPLPRPAWMR